MDVNGTRFHLIKSERDWETCCQLPGGIGEPAVTWDGRRGALTLHPVLSLFPRSPTDEPLPPTARRGAAVDQFGNWYWIAQDRRRLYWRPSGSDNSVVYWEQPEADGTGQAVGEFAPATPATADAALAGLAVTEDHYLVAGNVTEPGLLIFDLHAGGPPVALPFPDETTFTPFDITAADGGGLWVLDSVHRAYWGLDRAFRFVAEPVLVTGGEPPPPDIFTPPGTGPTVPPAPAIVAGFPLSQTTRPVSIVGQADGSVLVLDSPPDAPFSTVHRYELSEHRGAYPLDLELEVMVTGEGRRRQALPIVAHDMAYAAKSGTLYVVERDGNQAVAITLAETPPEVTVSRDYLPLHAAGGRALVAGTDGVFYDVAGNTPRNDDVVRWVEVQPVARPYYVRSATVLLGQPDEEMSPEAAPVFDGKERGCVWHRFFLDGCLPAGSEVRVWTRAHDERDLLQSLPFHDEPALYLRGDGTELPFYDPYPEKEPLPPGAGTWELLFQEARGRYLQIKLELLGNGRVTPQLRALRVYYPRFSYPRRFLPAAYVDESRPGPFLERLLANMEGFYTEIEGRMRDVTQLFDARTTPPEALDWLAGWVGLLLDPLWARLQEEREEHVPGRSRVADRRRLFIRFARKLYERRGTPDGIRFALEMLLEPCLETMLARLKAAALGRDEFVLLELARHGLPPPTPTSSEADLEDLLYEWVLRRPSQVRLVESFLVRRGRGRVSGDPTATGTTIAAENFDAAAHRFTVLTPMRLSPEEEAMIQRVVELEKPAHTSFTVRRYWQGFRVGEARLGLDTTLDQTNRFVAMLLGRDYLAAGYVDAAHPMNATNRAVPGRDRLGNLPPL